MAYGFELANLLMWLVKRTMEKGRLNKSSIIFLFRPKKYLIPYKFRLQLIFKVLADYRNLKEDVIVSQLVFTPTRIMKNLKLFVLTTIMSLSNNFLSFIWEKESGPHAFNDSFALR